MNKLDERDEMLEAIRSIVAPLNGSIVGVDEIDTVEGPIRLLYVGVGSTNLADAVGRVIPRMVFKGIICGEADTLAEARAILPPVVRARLGRWIWSQPWRPEDQARLGEEFPELTMTEAERQEIANEIGSYYADYTSTVSPYDMAVSLETAVFLLNLCRVTKPRAMMDFGSGFSSFLFRYYAREANRFDIVSVDDDTTWMCKSIGFCYKHHLDHLGRWVSWDDWLFERTNADVVFHDLAGGDLRNEAMPFAMQAANRFVVVDDCQAAHHRDRFYGIAEQQGFRSFALLQTFDHIQRFAMLAVR